MKYYKKTIFFFVTFFSLIYLIIGLIFYVSYTKAKIPFLESSPEIFTTFSNKLSSKGISKLYYLNPKVFSNDKSTFLLDFSRNDIKYKDSIFKLIKSGDILILEDRFKKWKKFNVIERENGISSKFKLHGSSIGPYMAGYESFTIKSEYPVNGYKKFKLITGLEMDYFNIFLNNIGKKFSLIAEDTGDIIATNSQGQIRDFFQYEIFDRDYLKSNYGIINPTIVRRNTFNDGINLSEWHASDLDQVNYNIDLDFINENDYNFWKEFNTSPEKSQFDPQYMGSFISLIQLFGHPHQITGNNDKWVISNKKMYPVYRNEGNIFPISVLDIRKNMVFEKYYYSGSLDVYKKMLTDEKVIYFRSLALKKIVDNRELIIKDLDSIYSKYEEIHRKYNQYFLRQKLNHRYIKKTITNNINSIENFLNSGFTILYFNGKELKITSTRNNKLLIETKDKSIEFNPTLFEYNQENKSLKLKNNELTIQGISDITDLKITDLILNKSLEIEKDYNILRSN